MVRVSALHTRREFLKTAAACAGAAATLRLFGAPQVRAEAAAGAKLRVAVIGCGIQGGHAHLSAALNEKLVAIVDADENQLARALRQVQKLQPAGHAAGIRTFTDYRVLFDKMGRELDAVTIATPNHHHALPALMAMKLGKGVYLEKPLAYNLSEVRALMECARTCKVPTQMGNQGHSGEGYRRLCEYIWAGAIGHVRTVYAWTNRSNGGVGPRPPSEPAPPGLHWPEWIGPAPWRDYHPELHPHEWHGWFDFGNGSLGNLGCHVLDGACWALQIEHPTVIEAEELIGGSDERYPVGTRLRWDFPARDGRPAVQVYWYDGLKKVARRKTAAADSGEVTVDGQNRPPLVGELEQKYNVKLGGNGALYLGDKGIMHTATYGGGVRILPEAQHQATPVPEKKLPRIKGSHFHDFFQACRGGPPPCASFDYGARLTGLLLLGDLAIRAGVGRKVVWDGPAMRCTNLPELNRYLQRENRKGWEA